jgi:hypothetical protein
MWNGAAEPGAPSVTVMLEPAFSTSEPSSSGSAVGPYKGPTSF